MTTSNKLAAIRARVAELTGDIQTATRELEIAKTQMSALEAEAAKMTVKEHLRTLTYDTQLSNGVVVSGSGFEQFVVPGREYPMGTSELSMEWLRKARVCDLSETFRTLFDEKHSDNILVQMRAFMTEEKWAAISKYDLFIVPINVVKRDRGVTRGLDMPNVTFAFACLAIQRFDVVVLDPTYKRTDAYANIIHLSHAMRGLFDMRLNVATAIQPHMNADDSFCYVFYMRAGGVPDEKTRRLVEAAAGTSNLMQVKVSPGKYDGNGWPNWGACYQEFSKSCVMILHTFSMLDIFAKICNKRTIRRIYFVMDSFSAYALYLAIAIKAYGLEQCAVFLTYFKGEYSHMTLF